MIAACFSIALRGGPDTSIMDLHSSVGAGRGGWGVGEHEVGG